MTFIEKLPVSPSTPYRMTPEFLRLVTFGYWTVAVDSLWINALADIGKRDVVALGTDRFDEIYDLGTRLDPDFYELYEQAGYLFGFFFDNAELTLKYTGRGLDRFRSGLAPAKYWAHPATLMLQQAYAHAFLRHDWARARKSYLEAADVPNAPQYVHDMKEYFKDEKSERLIAIHVLRSLVRNTRDEVQRRKYEERLKEYER